MHIYIYTYQSVYSKTASFDTPMRLIDTREPNQNKPVTPMAPRARVPMKPSTRETLESWILPEPCNSDFVTFCDLDGLGTLKTLSLAAHWNSPGTH